MQLFFTMRNLLKREPGLIALFVIPLLFFAPEILGATRFAGVDHTKLNMPMKHFDVMAASQGEIPLWNPYIATGAPHLAEGESGWFYVLNVVDHFPGNYFYWYGINIILHFIIAGITCYFLLRYKGAGRFSATIFAVLFQFAPFTMLHLAAVALFQVLAWVPLLLLLFEMVSDGHKPAMNILWGIFLVFQMLCIGSPQMLFFAFSAIFVLWILKFVVSKGKQSASNGIIFILLTAIGGSLLAACQLLPTAAFTQLSVRAADLPDVFHTDGTWLNWHRLATIFFFPATNFSDFEDAIGFGSSQVYIGPFGLLMVLLALLHADTRRKCLPYLLAAIPLLLFSFGYNFPPYRFLTDFPPFSLFRFLGRFSVLFVLFSMIPASLAFSNLLTEPWMVSPKLRKAGLIGLIAVVFLLAIYFATGQGSDISGYILLGISCLLLVGLVLFSRGNSRVPVIIAILLVITQLVALVPFARMMTLSRDGFDESLALVEEIEADDSIGLKRMILGYPPWVVDSDALINRSYKSRDWMIDSTSGLCSMMNKIGVMYIYLPLRESKWERMISARLLIDLMDDPSVNEAQSENICWILGINYVVVDNSETLDLPGYVPYERNDLVAKSLRPTAKMFVRSEPYERFFLTRNVRSYKFLDEEGQPKGQWQFLTKLLPNATPKDISGVVLPEDQEPVLFDDAEKEVGGTIEIVRENFNSIELSVNCEKDCYLVARENHHPGWNLKVDDQPTKIYRADYVNRAVYLTAGEHKIEFDYEPKEFLIGVKISFIAGVLFIFACLGVMRGSRKKVSG